MVIPGYPSSPKAASTTGNRSSRTIASTFFIRIPPAGYIVRPDDERYPQRLPILSCARLGPRRRRWRRGDLLEQLGRDRAVELLLHHKAAIPWDAELRNVESQHFDLRRHAHGGEHLVEAEDAHRRAETPGEVYANADELGSELAGVAVEEAFAVSANAVPTGAVRAVGEETKCDQTPGAAEAVD